MDIIKFYIKSLSIKKILILTLFIISLIAIKSLICSNFIDNNNNFLEITGVLG